MLRYLDLNNVNPLSLCLSTLCIRASDTMPPRRKPLEQCINHLCLSAFLRANGYQVSPVGVFPEQLLSARGQQATQGRQKKKVNLTAFILSALTRASSCLAPSSGTWSRVEYPSSC